MTENEFKERTKQVAIRVIKLIGTIPTSSPAGILGKQLLLSGTSIGANYRAACRGKSRADVLHKLAIVEEEADESLYWMELLIEVGIVPQKKLAPLSKEISEVLAMTVASIRTMKRNSHANPKSKI